MIRKYRDDDRNASISQTRHFFLNQFIPILLFILTMCTTIMSGVFLSGSKLELSASFWKGVPYALAILIVTGAHAIGHYMAARLNGVKAHLPCFIPTLGTIGTVGAYTKIPWPISDRKTLIKIFIAGPIVGFLVSWFILIIGLFFSELKDHAVTANPDKIRNSIIVYLTSLAFYGRLPETKDLLLHPVAYAGWLGLFYNFCHLLPIGRFDGGRLIYALWGYRVTRWVSFISIGILFVLGYFLSDWTVWLGVAIVGAIFTFGFRQQYSVDRYDQPIERSLLIAMIVILIIFIVSFSPSPL
jgi:membrane-associated protease RseP (regulator of RpoE activity)